jgi:hydroxypyruvate reductase
MPAIAESITTNDPQRRRRVVPVLQAALEAADPAAAVRRHLSRREDALQVGERSYRHVYLLGFGKAAVPMAEAAAQVLGDRLAAGAVVTKTGHGLLAGAALGMVEVFEAGHPLPDAAGVAAARQIAQLAAQATADDLVLCLISGGGSALLTLPADGLGLADLQQTTDAMLRCGATIDEINTLRKHLSQVKGGQLARLVAPATLAGLVLSDVVGSPLDVIASGPTVPDRSTWADAWAVVEKYGLDAAGTGAAGSELPSGVLQRLRRGLSGSLPDTPKAGDPAFTDGQTLVIADNAMAADAARAAAAAQGFDALILSTFVEGEAREVARVLVALGREVVVHARPLPAPACLILGGETTVTLRGQGQGGRNQELALAAALLLDRIPEGPRIVVAALATDGTDGPTDAAGGLVDAATVARGRELDLDAAGYLADDDAYPFLQAVGDLLVTGPTQTNVNDLLFVFVF